MVGSPDLYLAATIDLERAVAWLAEGRSARRPRLLMAGLFLKAVASSLREIPELNGFLIDGCSQTSTAVHLGVGVARQRGGPVIPVLLDAVRRDLALLPERPGSPLWVYRPVKRSSPDTCGRKPLKNAGVAGAAIGFKSPSSHDSHLAISVGYSDLPPALPPGLQLGLRRARPERSLQLRVSWEVERLPLEVFHDRGLLGDGERKESVAHVLGLPMMRIDRIGYRACSPVV